MQIDHPVEAANSKSSYEIELLKKQPARPNTSRLHQQSIETLINKKNY